MPTEIDDPFDLSRFVEAQRGAYDQALAEIRLGAKRSHWMWFVFPQIVGLGSSDMARRYAIGSRAEAMAYLNHPALGPRYEECVVALQDLEETTAEQVFGGIDALKLRSSLTLFGQAGESAMIKTALDRWFGGPDEATLRLLDARHANSRARNERVGRMRGLDIKPKIVTRRLNC